MTPTKFPLKALLLLGAVAGGTFATAAPAQPTSTAETDQAGQPGPVGPAGQATQVGPVGQAASPAATAGAQAAGQAGIGEIVVTAERRTANVQRTAASVSVRTGDELRKEGKYLLRDILENVPGINGGQLEAAGTVAGGGTDTAGAGVVIRGIRSNLGSGGSITSTASAVAIYTDDIYEGIGSTYDLDRVEILRGPQGTLYGRSATGGVVAVHTRNPDLDRFNGFGLVEIGNYGLRHGSASINAPIIDDKLAVRVSGDYFSRDGFDTDRGLGDRLNKNLRVKLLAKPTDNLSILLGAAIQYNEDATGGESPKFDATGKRYFTDAPIGSGKNHFSQYWANIQWDLGFATLTYIPAYREWHQDALNVGVGPGFLVFQTLETPKDHFLTNEMRLSSSSTSRLKWQVGALTYYNTLANSNTIRLAATDGPLAFSADTRKKTDAFGVFGEATYSLTDAWRVTGGVRYDSTKIDVAQDYTDGNSGQTLSIPNGSDDGHRTYHNWTYKIRTEYDLSPRNLIYASYSTGFSPGDVSVTSNAQNQPFVLDLKAETLKAAEIGSKNRFFDNKVQANASIYYYDYSGYQNAGIDVDERGGPFLAFDTLVAPVKIYGGELETIFQPTPRDRIALNLAYTDARYVNRSAEFKTYIARRHVADVPPFTADLSYSHRFDLSGGSSFTIVADGRYLSKHDAGTLTALAKSFGGTPLIREKGLGIANFTGTWTAPGGKLSIGGYVRNISDKRYSTLSEIELIAPPPTFQPVGLSGGNLRLTEPRTFGFIAQVNF